MGTFDPNGVGIANGNIFGFPVTEKEANIVIVPIPWDATASYGKGTSKGPKAILDASTQLDYFHHELANAYETKVFMESIDSVLEEKNAMLCEKAIDYIEFLENGGKLSENIEHKSTVSEINSACLQLKNAIKNKATKLINEHKIPAVLGGEHAVPLGLIEALNEKFNEFGILQIDAHADLRNAYESFEQSHASIMFNVLKNCSNMKRLVQVGIRDVAQSEIDLINSSNGRVKTFFDWDLKNELFSGKNWHYLVTKIIQQLPQKVYISFDIDGLEPSLCPNTGTPVAGGFKLEEINYLFFELVKSGREIIGFDLNEVGYDENSDWDANVGARALWNLVCATELSRRKKN